MPIERYRKLSELDTRVLPTSIPRSWNKEKMDELIKRMLGFKPVKGIKKGNGNKKKGIKKTE